MDRIKDLIVAFGPGLSIVMETEEGASDFQKMVLETFDKMILDAGTTRAKENILKREKRYFDLYVALQFIGFHFKIWQVPFSYLEVGTKIGGSMMQLVSAATLEFLNKVVSVDIWGGEDDGILKNNLTNFFKQLDRFGLGSGSKFPLIICNGSSEERLKTIYEAGWKFDVITIDARHEEKYADHDLGYAVKLLNPSGIIVFDDIVHPAHSSYMMKVVEKHREGFNVFTSNSGNGIAILYR